MTIRNWISGKLQQSEEGDYLKKYNPHNGEFLYEVTNSSKKDIDCAIRSAQEGFSKWSKFTPVQRGQILYRIVSEMRSNIDQIADCMVLETGKSRKDAISEINGAIAQGEFFAGEGMRLYGRSLTSSIPGKHVHSVREPHGIVALIVPSNTPIANIAWKTFPALICGNSIILKASEDSPKLAIIFAKITKAAGLPDDIFNVVQGEGKISGSILVSDNRVSLISFTGSTVVGREIARIAGSRLARVSLELGGKNPFIVCDDADIDQAVHWAILSAFSNAGQRCAAGSRILIFRGVYEIFREKFVFKAKQLKLGLGDECHLGPVINKKQQSGILDKINEAITNGGKLLCGGCIPSDPNLEKGYYIQPTIIENLDRKAFLSTNEIFGPVATLHIVEGIYDALDFSNSSEYGLTAAIHTRDLDIAVWFAHRIRTGTINVNLGTYGSEPHMPFGGFGFSGNGTREPGVEAIDVYSELKNISFYERLNLMENEN